MSASGHAALLTGPGPAAIAVVRLTGAPVVAFVAAHVRWRSALAALPPGSVRRATLLDSDGAPLDDVLVSIHATTPVVDVRLHLHGSPGVVARCLELAAAHGLEVAPPNQNPAREGGEYGTDARTSAILPAPATRVGGSDWSSHSGDAELWPAGDALDAAAAALLPSMLTERGVLWVLEQTAALRGALQELRTTTRAADAAARIAALTAGLPRVKWFQRPLRVPLVGPPNAGKSTLANALADRAVSLTSAQPGTTRDWVEVPGEVAGLPVCWQDTAGVRATFEPLEASAIELTHALIDQADVVVLVTDRSTGSDIPALKSLAATAAGRPLVIVRAKSDLPGAGPLLTGATIRRPDAPVIDVSATAGSGLSELGAAVLAAAGRDLAALPPVGALTDGQAGALTQAVRLLPEVSRFNEHIADIIGGAQT